ncbi:MAG: ankyrin repeat domain-containing protein [Methylophilus sp.]|nr:ankyrin repeat domain-containing protein [Methylophilus sp.]
MNQFKALFAILALGFSLNSMAITDDQSVEFTGACNEGDLKTVKRYIEKEHVNVNDKYFAWSALQMAATRGHLDIVKYLVEHGADMDYAHPLTKMTPFHLAAFDGYEDIVKYLASKGADINKKMKGDISLIRVMKDEGPRAEKMVKLLTELGVKDDGCQDEKCF